MITSLLVFCLTASLQGLHAIHDASSNQRLRGDGAAAPDPQQGAPCGTRQSEVQDALRPWQEAANAPQLRFYLHEEGGFNLSKSVKCFFENIGSKESIDDVDLHVLPNVAEHITDYWLIQQLRKHPARTYDADAADLHVIGAPLYMSYAANNVAGCSNRQHNADQRAVENALRALPQFQRSGGSDFLFIDTAPINTMGGTKVLNKGLRELLFPHAILATADLDYWGNKPENFGDFVNNAIVIPYKAHFMLDSPAEVAARVASQPRNVSVMFHGDMTRGSGGRWVFMNITDGLQDTSVLEHNSNSGDRRREAETIETFQEVSISTAKTYLRSSFCLVSPGDSPTSRRLFDALASGCTPVLFGDFEKQMLRNLPFKASIDWSQVALFAGSLKCTAGDIDGTKEWLRGLVEARGGPEVVQMRQRGMDAFAKLSYHSMGIVDALLREVQLRKVAD